MRDWKVVQRDDACDCPNGSEDDSIPETLVAINIRSQSNAPKGCQYGGWCAEEVGANAGEANRFDDRGAPSTEAVYGLETA